MAHGTRRAGSAQSYAKLRGDTLGKFDSIVMAVAGSAPAYTIAGTTAALAGEVALAGPAALLYCGIPMLGIAFAFNYLTRVDVNAGASYSWVARALHPALGFISGWALVVSALIFMVIGSLPAGAATLSLFSASAAQNTTDTLAVGAAWFLVMLILVGVGIRITAHAQWIMSGVEVALLLAVGVAALLHGHFVTRFSWHWFGPGNFHSVRAFAGGALIAAFYYWGWDVTSNLSEETKRSRRTSGMSGLIGVLIVFAMFEFFAVVVNLTMTPTQIGAHADNVLSAIGAEVWPGAGGKVMVLAVMLSTVATLETTLIQISRTLFAMGRDRTIPRFFGWVHPRRQTPWAALAVVGAAALGLFVVSNKVGSVNEIMGDAFDAIGLQICVYYGLAAVSVVVAYRRLLFSSPGNLLFIGLWPLTGAVFMGWIFYESLPALNATTRVVGLGALAAGLIPLFWYWMRGSSYYRSERLDAARAKALSEVYDADADDGAVLAAAAAASATAGDGMLATDL